MLSEYVDTQNKERGAMWIHFLPVVSLALTIRLVYVPMAFLIVWQGHSLKMRKSGDQPHVLRTSYVHRQTPPILSSYIEQVIPPHSHGQQPPSPCTPGLDSEYEVVFQTHHIPNKLVLHTSARLNYY